MLLHFRQSKQCAGHPWAIASQCLSAYIYTYPLLCAMESVRKHLYIICIFRASKVIRYPPPLPPVFWRKQWSNNNNFDSYRCWYLPNLLPRKSMYCSLHPAALSLMRSQKAKMDQNLCNTIEATENLYSTKRKSVQIKSGCRFLSLTLNFIIFDWLKWLCYRFLLQKLHWTYRTRPHISFSFSNPLSFGKQFHSIVILSHSRLNCLVAFSRFTADDIWQKQIYRFFWFDAAVVSNRTQHIRIRWSTRCIYRFNHLYIHTNKQKFCMCVYIFWQFLTHLTNICSILVSYRYWLFDRNALAIKHKMYDLIFRLVVSKSIVFWKLICVYLKK